MKYRFEVQDANGEYFGTFQSQEYAVRAIEDFWHPLKRQGNVMKPMRIRDLETGSVVSHFDSLD